MATSVSANRKSASSWTLEDKIHIHKQACNILYVYVAVNFLFQLIFGFPLF